MMKVKWLFMFSVGSSYLQAKEIFRIEIIESETMTDSDPEKDFHPLPHKQLTDQTNVANNKNIIMKLINVSLKFFLSLIT